MNENTIIVDDEDEILDIVDKNDKVLKSMKRVDAIN